MTPKEKARELVDKFIHPVRWKMGQEGVRERAKQCALIAVDEILKPLNDIGEILNIKPAINFYEEVKQEIEKL